MPVTFAAAAARHRHGFVIGGLLIAAGIAVLVAPAGVVEGAAPTAALAFVLAIVMMGRAWWSGRRRGIALRLDETGLWFEEWQVTVPWPEIVDVYQKGSRLQPYVGVRLRDPDALLATLDAAERDRLSRSRCWRPPELRIVTGLVDGRPRDIVAAIAAARDAHGGDGGDAPA